MLTPEDFAERYKNISDSGLLEILRQPLQYQPEALTAAKSEFISRQLSEDKILDAEQILLEKKIKKEKIDARTELLRTRMVNTGNFLYDRLNPIQNSTPTTEKFRWIISMSFSIIIFYQLVENFHFISAILKGHDYGGFGYTLYLFPLLLMIIGTVLFWLRKQAGWLILVVLSILSLIEEFWSLCYSISLQFRKSQYVTLFPTPSPSIYFFSGLFYLAALVAMCRREMKQQYKIDKQKMQAAFIAGCLIGILFIFLTSFPYI